MIDHEAFQQQIPEYLAGSLADSDAVPLEAHLDDCPSCAGIVRDWRPLLPELGAAASLEPHPEIPRLRRAASGTPDPDLLRHAAACPRCSLELDVWSRRLGAPASASGPVATTGRPAWSRRAGLAAIAASLFLGAGLATLTQYLLIPRSSRPEPWAGTAPLLVLDGVLRGDDAAPAAAIGPRQPYLPLAVVPALDPSVGDDERIWFGLAPAGSIETVWETAVGVGEIRRQVRQSGAVTFLIPVDGLGEGEYLVRTRRGGSEGGELGSEIPFVLVRDGQRQSPAATKPPQ